MRREQRRDEMRAKKDEKRQGESKREDSRVNEK